MLLAAIKKKLVIALHGQPGPRPAKPSWSRSRWPPTQNRATGKSGWKRNAGFPTRCCSASAKSPSSPKSRSSTRRPSPRAPAGATSRKSSPPSRPSRLRPPAVVNGQILPGKVDRYRSSQQRQRLVLWPTRGIDPVYCRCRAGLVSGHSGLLRCQRERLAYDDHYRFSPDPVLYYEIAADGQYMVEIRTASIADARISFIASPSANCPL